MLVQIALFQSAVESWPVGRGKGRGSLVYLAIDQLHLNNECLHMSVIYAICGQVALADGGKCLHRCAEVHRRKELYCVNWGRNLRRGWLRDRSAIAPLPGFGNNYGVDLYTMCDLNSWSGFSARIHSNFGLAISGSTRTGCGENWIDGA